MKPIFRSIGQLFKRERDPSTEPMFGLSKEQLSQLKALRDSDEWQVYTATLDIAVRLYGETLLHSRNDAELHEARGYVLGIRRAAGIVDELLAKEADANHASRLHHDAADAGRHSRSAALYGSPAFRRGD